MLKINNLSAIKGNKQILTNINLQLDSGKIYGILGANGAGKSTLLDGVFELDSVHDMSCDELLSRDVKSWQENIGYMLQNFHTHSDLSALEVVLLGAYNELNIKVSDEVLERALGILDEFGIVHLANLNIQQLSGGQRQMIAFAQVLLKSPRILLLDEPVSALDLRHQCILLEALQSITKSQNLTSLVVLHDLNLASLFCDEVIIIHGGKVHKKGSPSSVLTSELIQEIYGVNVKIINENNKPFIQVLSSLKS